MRFGARCWLVLGLAVGVSACGDLFGLDDPDVSLSLGAEPASLARLGAASFEVGGRRFRVEPDDAPLPTYRSVEAPRDGELTVVVTLLDTAGATLGETSYRQRFRAGWSNWVSVIVGMQRPLGVCTGDPLAVPLVPAAPGAAPDTMFIASGGIPKGAIC